MSADGRQARDCPNGHPATEVALQAIVHPDERRARAAELAAKLANAFGRQARDRGNALRWVLADALAELVRA